MSTELLTQIDYRNKRRSHWDSLAKNDISHHSLGGYYHSRLEEVYYNVVAPNLKILEIGSGNGNLLASLNPAFGLGIDISGHMLALAKEAHPEINFVHADGSLLPLIDASFDIVILSDVLNDAWDVQEILQQIKNISHEDTRIIINVYSRFWQLPLYLAQLTRLATPLLPQNWLTPDDLNNLLELEGFEPVRTWGEILAPLNLPIITPLCNRYIAKLWPFTYFVLSHFIVARKRTISNENKAQKKVSVIIPARNEAGNIANIFERTPNMGLGTELVFVEGHSKDDTYKVIEEEIAKHPQHQSQLHQQNGIGKGDAVRKGFAEATGDILMILDADLTVPPEMLPRFYEVIQSGKGEFANGVRLVYPMEDRAMRFLNLLGNKFFSLAFSWLLGQPIKDTLCGTKVLSRKSYASIAENRSYFGEFDPFGDFDLLFGAARQNFKIVEIPIRYRERTYGDTNIDRWRHGALLLRMVFFAARRLKFI